MSAEYDWQRRVTKVPKVDRVERSDKTEALDMGRKAKFEAALGRAADDMRAKRQHERHHTYGDAEARLKPAKKRP
jgi:hypothetical protein